MAAFTLIGIAFVILTAKDLALKKYSFKDMIKGELTWKV